MDHSPPHKSGQAVVTQIQANRLTAARLRLHVHPQVQDLQPGVTAGFDPAADFAPFDSEASLRMDALDGTAGVTGPRTWTGASA